MVEPDLSHRAQRAADREWEPPSLQRRFFALMLDWIACLLISNTFADPVAHSWAPVAVLIVEYALLVGLFGQTLGMYLTKLRCLGFESGRPIGVPRALLRAFLLALFVPALIMDSDRRGIHDRLAGSVVIAAPRPELNGKQAASGDRPASP